MSSILDTLEERLLQFLLEQETKKTWEDWLQWMADLDCPLEFEKPHQIPNRPFSFQIWFEACEQQISQHPEWHARLNTPAWLKRQNITVLPKVLKSRQNKTPGITEIGGLQTELTRMIDQIHTVQQRIANLDIGSKLWAEKRSDSQQINTTHEEQTAIAVSGLSDTLGRPDLARTLEMELQIHNKMTNVKGTAVSKSDADILEPEIVELKTAYLSYNRWCDQFDEVHLDLQDLVKDTLRVANSHQISFQQFSHRILKNAKNVKQLKDVLESFTRLRGGGININLPEPSKTEETTGENSNS